jgi:hypothetical protein
MSLSSKTQPPQYTRALKRGTTYRARVTVKRRSGALFDLTGWTPSATLRRNTFESADVAATFAASIEAPVSPALFPSALLLELSKTQVASLTPGVYVFDVMVTKGAERFAVVASAEITVLAAATREA